MSLIKSILFTSFFSVIPINYYSKGFVLKLGSKKKNPFFKSTLKKFAISE